MAPECRPRSHVVGTIAQAGKLLRQLFPRLCALIGARVEEALPTLSVIWWTNEKAPERPY